MISTYSDKRVILNQPSPGEEKFSLFGGRVTWPFEIELPDYVPPDLFTRIRSLLALNNLRLALPILKGFSFAH
jgi:hypothetical protein